MSELFNKEKIYCVRNDKDTETGFMVYYEDHNTEFSIDNFRKNVVKKYTEPTNIPLNKICILGNNSAIIKTNIKFIDIINHVDFLNDAIHINSRSSCFSILKIDDEYSEIRMKFDDFKTYYNFIDLINKDNIIKLYSDELFEEIKLKINDKEIPALLLFLNMNEVHPYLMSNTIDKYSYLGSNIYNFITKKDNNYELIIGNFVNDIEYDKNIYGLIISSEILPLQCRFYYDQHFRKSIQNTLILNMYKDKDIVRNVSMLTIDEFIKKYIK